MRHAAIYARVSTDDKGQDPDQQVPLVRQMLEQRGYEVPPDLVFIDEHSGGKGREGRPDLDQLLDAAHRGRFAAVGVWKLNRFSRDGSFTGGLLLVGELDHFNVSLISHQETYLDTAGPWRRPLVSIALQVAQEERERIGADTRRALAKKKTEAATTGGFLVTGEKSKRRGQVIAKLGRPGRLDPATIAQAAAERAAGASWGRLARELGCGRGAIERAVCRHLSQNGGRQ